MTLPYGALTEDEKIRLRTLSKHDPIASKTFYYIDNSLYDIRGPAFGYNLGFMPFFHYFDNYFHAWAYSLRMKQRIKGKGR